VLVDPQWLEDHLEHPNVRVIEVDVSRAAYDDWHVPGAVLWNVYADLKDSHYATVDAAAMEKLAQRSGIAADSTLVFYGYAPALAFWLMKMYAHADIRILDCDRRTWHAEGHPTTKDASEVAVTDYVLAEAVDALRARQIDVQNGIDSTVCTIVDVRSSAEYAGERFWPSGGTEPGGRSGHVPSARHLPIDHLWDGRGSFLDAADLADVFSTVDLANGQAIITYCTIGGRASTAWFVLTYLLGQPGVRVYDGSWAEWGLMSATPVA